MPPQPITHHIDPTTILSPKPTTIHHWNSAPTPPLKLISKPSPPMTKSNLQTHNHVDLVTITTTRSLTMPSHLENLTNPQPHREGRVMRKWVEGQWLVRGMGRERVISKGTGEKERANGDRWERERERERRWALWEIFPWEKERWVERKN